MQATRVTRTRHRAWLRIVPLTAFLLLITLPAAAAPSSVATATPETTPADTAPPEPSAIQTPEDPADDAFRAELASRQARLDELEAQLEALDRELAIASEAYNRAIMELDATRARLDVTRTDLANAEVAFSIQQATLADRVRDLYHGGELNVLGVLLSADSLADFVARVKFLHAIGANDARITEELRVQRDQIAATTADLEDAELQARSLEFEAEARTIEVMLRIQEREALLANAQADLLQLLDERAAERQAQEAALLRAVLDGASDVGIVVEPNSPVETALGYHGVPYLWGGASVAGFDCSGLVMYVFNQHGVMLPHYSGAQFLLGEKIVPADLQPGDVVFFGSPVHHVGIYVGAGYFIHAPRTGDFVKLSSLAERSDYAGARRYDWAYRESRIENAVADPAAIVGH